MWVTTSSQATALLSHWRANKWPSDKQDSEALACIFDWHRDFAFNAANQALQTLRWRSGDFRANQSLSLPSICFSLNGEDWDWFAPPKPAGIPRPRIVREWNSSEIIDDVQTQLNEKKSWPIAFELFQEASDLREDAPRSAVVLTISAFEAAVKEFIRFYPKAKLRSGSSIHLLNAYLPLLCDRFPCPPRRVRATLQKGVELRNNIAHEGEKGPSLRYLLELLNAVEDPIWLLEWCKGFDRAWAFIGGQTRDEYFCEDLQRTARKIKAAVARRTTRRSELRYLR